jgi:phosphonate transport system substrate-binding protein
MYRHLLNRKKWLILIVLASSLVGCGQEQEFVRGENVPDDWPKELVIGLFGGDDANEVMERNELVIEHLQNRLGIPVKSYIGSHYSGVIEAMRAGRAHAMTVGAFAYILAVKEAGAEALAITRSDAQEYSQYEGNNDFSYFSAIVTRKGSGIRTLEDLRGKDFNFVDPASTSGHLAPRSLLLKHGIDPDKDLNVFFAGSHPTSILTVKEGRSDAGASMLAYLYRMQSEGLIDFCGFTEGQVASPEIVQANYDNCPDGHIAIVALTDPIPRTPFSVRSDLPDSLKKALKSALMEVKDMPELREGRSRWVYYIDPVEELGLKNLDEYYNPLREMAKLLELDLHELAAN